MRSNRWITCAGLATAMVVVSACASIAPGIGRPTVTPGSVTEHQGGQVVFCTGQPGGAIAGQELLVVERTRRPLQPSNPSGAVRAERRTVGSVRVVELVDGHYARAQVVSGVARRGAVVELAPARLPLSMPSP